MSGYDFLTGVRVLEVAQLGPSSLGGYLADMGAEVIKVEGEEGDPVRYSGQYAVGSPKGPSFMHLRWNRGKKSLGLNLKSPEGIAVFRDLVRKSDVVIEGMRGGTLARLGLGYDVLKELNPKVVFCSISGLGSTGPYCTLGSHGPSFDAFGALSSANPYALAPELQDETSAAAPVGMHAMGLNAALGVLSALIRAQRTGMGAYVEVSGAESAAHWLPDSVNSVVNAGKVYERPGFLNSKRKMSGWPRLSSYRTKDGRHIFFQALFPKFWERFCHVVDSAELTRAYADGRDSGEADEEVYGILVKLFETRSYDEWMAVFIDNNIPAGPANTALSLSEDPHFTARDNVYETEQRGVGALRLSSSPVKTSEQVFAPLPAPEQWQDSEIVLREILEMDEDCLSRLRLSGAVYINDPF